MSGLVLYFCEQNGLTPQRGCAGYPVAFRQHADNFRVRMLANLADQRLTVCVRHPVLRLDGRFLRDALVKALFFCHVITL